MGSTYGGYYGDYSGGYNSGYYGYNQQGGSVLGSNTSMSMNNSQIGSAPELTQQNPASKIMDGITKTYNDGLQSQKKSGGIGDFFNGIFNGIKNLFKSLLDPKTWLMIAACVALCVLVPGAGAVLMALGIGMAGMQIFKGAQSGDMEQVGEGAFNLGLSFLGGSSAVKAGKGAEAANFSRAGTRVAEAESSLAAAKKAGDVKAVESAQKTVELARAQMAKSDASAMSAAQREAHLKNPNVSSLKTADDFKAAKSTAQNSLMEAKAGLDDAQAALTAAEKTKDATKIARAKQDLEVAEAQVKQAADNVHDVYLAERIQATKDMGMMGKSWEYIKGTGTRTTDSFSMLFGKPMTSADGRTITYWSRTPKTPEAAAANAEAATTKTGSNWNPFNWGKSKPAEKTKGAASADEAAATSDKSKAAVVKDETSPPTPPKKPKTTGGAAKPKKPEYASKEERIAAQKAEQERIAAERAKAKAKYDELHGLNTKGKHDPTKPTTDDTRYNLESLYGKEPKTTGPKSGKTTEISYSQADIEAIQKANAAYFQKRFPNGYQESATSSTGRFAEAPPVWERIKGNIAPGIFGSQTAITPLFGGMLGGGDGGGLFG